MSFINAISLLYNPDKEWQNIADKQPSVSQIYLTFIVFFAAIPPVSAFIGSTYVGWSIGDGDTHRLTFESALYLSIVAYVAILVAIGVVAALVQWMAVTYNAKPQFRQSMALTAYSFTPLFLAGFLGSFPILWLDMLFTLVAIGFSINLLYKGVPTIMGINKERGILFAGSILTVCMVGLIGMFAITIVFWGSGLSPIFTS